MISRRRQVASGYRPPLLLCCVCAALLLSPAVFAQIQTEVVSGRMIRVSSVGGGTQLVPDLAVSGQVVVQLAPGVTAQQLAARLAANNCTLLKTIPNTPLVVVGLPKGMSVVEGRDLWAREAIAELAVPDYMKYLMGVPNDPMYTRQWHWPRISAPIGWDTETGAASTVVAICDSGYDPDHPDLVDRYWVNQAELAGTADVDDDGNGRVDDIYGWDFVNDDNNPDAGPQTGEVYEADGVRHGTHCAGAVGATTNNRLGVAGHDWACRLMMLRVAGSTGGSDTMVLSGIQYAIDMGADVISLSLGGSYSPAYDIVFANAHAAGVVVVAAAGNESLVFTDDPGTWQSPVCNDGPNLGVDNFVLGVGASDASDTVGDFSNRDASSYNFVDVIAPGVDIYSTYYSNPAFPDLAEEYGPMTGTSMACPIAAGLCALVKAHFPGMSAADIINQVRITCDNIDAENPLIAGTIGAGRINTAAALGIDVPPEPPTNVQAFDTPKDEGGSITVTWSLSKQDGEDVRGYRLLRAPESTMVPGMPGSFAQIAELAPGTNFYLDTPVPDHTKFWYQVVVFDAVNSVPSAIAGPAEARDDLAPPAIENLVATDTQADDGGSITLSWFGYEYPPDLAGYNIYRATAPFTDTSGMTPIATRTPGQGQHYVDATTTDGTEYWYAVGPFDDEGNEETEVTVAGPAVSNPNFAFSYSPGLSLIAVGALPAEDANIAQILGGANPDGINFAAWDPSLNGGAGGYVIWSESPGAAVFRQALGRAWWLRSNRALLTNISGQEAPSGDFRLQVVAGWNLWGNPFTTRLDFGATEVTGIGQGTPVSLATSNRLGYTRDYAWGYDPFTNSYKLITAVNLPFATNIIEPGRGVFFLARRPATLLLKRSVATAEAAEPLALDGWSLQLVAEAAGAADTDNFLGVSSQAAQLNGVVSPPRPDVDLDLYFVRPAAEGARLATDFVESAAAGEWTIRVACATPGATVRLSWPDLSQLPASCRPVLVDEDSGRAIYLRTSTGYTYEVGDEAAERHFTLRISDGDAGALTIGALSAEAAGGRAQIVYTLSADATVDVEVLNIAGVTVRRLVGERAQAAGPQQLTWDGRNNAGSAVPAGSYLVRITARSENGQQVSAVRSLQLGR